MQKGLNCIVGARVQRGQTLRDTTVSVSTKLCNSDYRSSKRNTRRTEPAGPSSGRIIRSMGQVALGRVVLTSREHVIALEARDQGLMGVIRSSGFGRVLAKHIVHQTSGHFDSSTSN